MTIGANSRFLRKLLVLIAVVFALELINLKVAFDWHRRVPAPMSRAAANWTNGLGMRFLLVPGEDILFGETEVRVRDFRAFVEATKREWPQPDLESNADHPAVNVTWDDAREFCGWLTTVERQRLMSALPHDVEAKDDASVAKFKQAMTRAPHEYRLPTDAEWSRAAGIVHEPGATPADRVASLPLNYAWGSAWPPPPGSGNFAGEEAPVDPSEPGAHIPGYRDAFPRLAPVAQFAPNRFGLYDLAGNALEWCEDWYSPAQRGRVMRGGSWLNGDPQSVALNHRAEIPPRAGLDVTGFRCVLAPVRDTRLAPAR